MGRTAFLFAALFVAGCGPGQPASLRPASDWTSPTFPEAAWVSVPRPDLVGYHPDSLAGLRQYLTTLPTTAFMAVVHGRVLFSYGDLDSLSYLASARKSVLSMLYGPAVAAGKVRLDRTLADIGIDDVGGLTSNERRATVEDLLEARSGVYHPASNPGDDLDSAPPRGSQAPGRYFLYSNWDFNALGTIFELATGRNIYDALEQDLARPIGMERFRRDIHSRSGDTTRSLHRAYHMTLSTRDMARLGLLMLNEGRWKDRQLIPRDWVRRSTSTITPSNRMNPAPARAGGLGYGFLWWTLEAAPGSPLAGAYSARGALGQYILIVPKLDLVVVHKRAPGRGGAVGWNEFMVAVRRLVEART